MCDQKMRERVQKLSTTMLLKKSCNMLNSAFCDRNPYLLKDRGI